MFRGNNIRRTHERRHIRQIQGVWDFDWRIKRGMEANRNSSIIEGCVKENYSLSVKIKRRKDEWCEVVTTVYGPNDSRLCNQLWKGLRQIHHKWNRP